MALGRTIAELDAEMSSEEFTGWLAYYAIEPFGAERDNIHAGIIASTIANVDGGTRRTWTARDFMVIDKTARQDENTEKFIAGLRALAKPATTGGDSRVQS